MSYEMDQMHGFSNDRDPLSPRRMNYRMNSGSTEEFQNMKEDTASIRSVQMIPTTRSSLRLVITNTWINLLLVVVPVSRNDLDSQILKSKLNPSTDSSSRANSCEDRSRGSSLLSLQVQSHNFLPRSFLSFLFRDYWGFYRKKLHFAAHLVLDR